MSEPLKKAARRHYKVWTSEDQIVAKIDRTKNLERKKRAACEEWEKISKALYKKAGDFFTEWDNTDKDETEVRNILMIQYRKAKGDAEMAKSKSERFGSESARLREQILPRLKEVHRAFKTQTMTAILGNYQGVAVR